MLDKNYTQWTRRGVLVRALGLGGMTALLAACQAQAPAATPASNPGSAPPAAASAAAPSPGVPQATGSPSVQTASASASPQTAPAVNGPASALKMAGGLALSDAGAVVAKQKGYFAEQGLSVEFIQLATPADSIGPLSTGQLDMASEVVSPGLVNATTRGLNLKLVADKGSMPKGHGFNSLVARQDLYDAGSLRQASDLKGKTISLESPVTVAAFEVAKLLESAGLPLTDVTLLQLAIPDMLAALANKKVDAAWEIEPFGTLAESNGVGHIIITADQFVPDLQVAEIGFTSSLTKERADTGRAWMIAYLKGLRFYNDAFKDPSIMAELVDILSTNTNVTDKSIYARMIWPGLHPDGKLNVQSLLDQETYFKGVGQIEQVLPAEQLVDPSFTEYAVKQLGPYTG